MESNILLHLFLWQGPFDPSLLQHLSKFKYQKKLGLRLDPLPPFGPMSQISIFFLSTIFCFSPFDPIPQGGGDICPPPHHISAIFSRSTCPRRLQLYSKFKFHNYVTPKISLVLINFPTAPWESLKVRRVANFCLEIDNNFTFNETRWIFLAEI